MKPLLSAGGGQEGAREDPRYEGGVLVFSFTDELWKAGNPDKQDVGGWAPASSGVPYDGTANEEYWGILDVNRHKKDAFHVLKEFYNNPEN